MRKLVVTGLLLASGFIVCAQTNPLAQKVAALPGSYRHSPPCEDCTGIQTTLTLNCDAPCTSGRYIFTEEGVNTINGDKSNGSAGQWKICDTVASPNGNTVILMLTDEDLKVNNKNYFMLVDGSLEQLDKKKQHIDPPFNIVLLKLPDGAILDLR